MKDKNFANPWLGLASAIALVAAGIGVSMQAGLWRYHSFVAFLGLAILALATSSFVTMLWKDYVPNQGFTAAVILICLALIGWFFTPGLAISPRHYFKLEIVYTASLILSVLSIGSGLGGLLLKDRLWYRANVVVFNLMLMLFLASQFWLYIRRMYS